MSAPPSDLLRSLIPPEANPAAPPPLQFPWPEVRDFISTMVSGMMAQQNLMIGEQLLAASSPHANPEQVQTLQELVKKLDAQLQGLNQAVESKLRRIESDRPKIIIPRAGLR